MKYEIRVEYAHDAPVVKEAASWQWVIRELEEIPLNETPVYVVVKEVGRA